MINTNQTTDGYLISRTTANQRPMQAGAASSGKSNSLPEVKNQHMKAMENFYRGDNSQFTSVESGNRTGAGNSDPRVFEARKKLVDPLGLVPEQAKTGVDRSKTNIDGKTVEVGTFNMEWLGCDEARMFFNGKPTGAQPRTEQDYQKMADAIKQSGAEVMAVQEISDEKALQKVVGNLPGYDYVLGTTGKREDGKSQMVGIIYNGEKITCDKSSVTEIMEAQVPELAGDGHLRAPLAAKFKSKEGGFDFTMVAMHLKAGQKGDCKQIRDAQVSVINKWAKDRMAAGEDKDIIFAGDFNDTLNSSTTRKLGEGTDLHMVTSEAAIRDEWSHPVTHRLIDQIGVTTVNGGSLEEYIPGTTGVVRGERVTSDHRPVVASFKDVDND